MPLFTLTLLAIGVGVGGWRLVAREGGSSVAPPSLRFFPLPLIGLALQLLALRWASGSERFALIVGSQLLLLAFCVANIHYAALRLLLVGFLLNFLPMLTSSGYMPITPEAARAVFPQASAEAWSSGFIRSGSKDIVLPIAESPLWFLGDVFVIPRPFVFATAFSIGDILIVLGFGAAVWQFTSSKGDGNGAY